MEIEPNELTNKFMAQIENMAESGGENPTAQGPVSKDQTTLPQEALLAAPTSNIPGVSKAAEALRNLGYVERTVSSITSQAPAEMIDIRNQFLHFTETELGVEPNNTPEWLVSSERGRWLVEQVAYMETELSYEVRWNERNGPILYELSRKLTEYVEKIKQRDRYLEERLDPKNEHKVKDQKPTESLHDAINRAYDERLEKGVAKAKKGDEKEPIDFTEIDGRGESLSTLSGKYLDPDLSIADREQVEKDLLKYFEEAHRKGLLKEVDEVYKGIYLGFKNKSISKKDALVYLMRSEPEARQALRDALMSKAKDPEVNPRLLSSIPRTRTFLLEEVYIEWTRLKLRNIINGERPGDHREGEWRIPGEEDEEGEPTELYWKPYGGYPNYYTIEAQTPAQFRIAKESFLQMLRDKALGYDPNELMTHLVNFKQVLTARAEELAVAQQKQLQNTNKAAGPDHITTGFVEELRQEFESRAFLWHMFYNAEHYNKDGFKQGAMAMALHEGPQRWTRALRSGENGGVGYHNWQMDNNPLHEFFLNAQGSRGQFGRKTQVYEFIRSTIKQIGIERGMGILLKDYDWRDVDLLINPHLRLKRAKRLDQLEKHLRENDDDLDSFEDEDDRDYYEEHTKKQKKNQEWIGVHRPNEALKALYEGFHNSDAHRNNYKHYIVDNGLDIDNLPADFPKKFRDSVRLGKIQTLLDQLRTEVRAGTVSIGREEKLIDKLIKLKRISRKEKRLYDKFYADSVVSHEVATQMQGATHETTIRGGAVYFVHRNKYMRAFLDFRQEYRPTQKAKESDFSDWSLQERAKVFSKDQYIGWIINEMRLGKGFDDFTLEEQYLFYDAGHFDKDGNFQFKDAATKAAIRGGTFSWVTPLDRGKFVEGKPVLLVDHIPAHQAQKAGMTIANWVRIQYGDDAEIWNRPELKAIIEEKNSKGNFKNKNFRAIYRNAVIEATLNIALDQIMANGFEAKFSYADYELVSFDDKTGEIELKLKTKPSGAIDLKPIKLKQPHIFGYTQNGQAVIAFDGPDGQPVFGFDTKGRVYLTESDKDESDQWILYDKPSGQRKRINLDEVRRGFRFTERKDDQGVSSYVSMEEVEADLQTASENHLALHTAHTYWAYQNNNTHTLLPNYVFEQAKQIRDGLLRPEDADIFAGLLLTLDPTLTRVKSFDGEQMAIESLVFDAAVEESLQNWIGMRDMFKGRFLPSDGNVEHMATGYYAEDQGGDFRFSLQSEALMAKMSKRWARRFAAALKLIPIHADTMAGNLGRKGVIGAVSMMDDKIHELTTQRIASQFAITKFINLMDSSTTLWFRLVGGTDPKTGDHHEGLFMKPTNNADKLAQLKKKFPEILQMPNSENEAFYFLLDSFGRTWDVLRAIRTMYSDNRNAGGALDLRKTDVFLPNGRINPDITKETERYTGTSRHIAKKFWDLYANWLMDEGPGGGQQAYGDVAWIYKQLKNPFLEERFVEKGEFYVTPQGETMEATERQLVEARDIKIRKKLVKAGEIYINSEGKKMRSKVAQEVISWDSFGRTWSDWLFDKMAL